MKKILPCFLFFLALAAAPEPPKPPAPPQPPEPAAKRQLQKPLNHFEATAAAAAPRLASPEDATNAPDYLVLSTFTIEDGAGGRLTAKLGGSKFPSIRADARSCVVIFTARWTNYVIEATADAGGFSNWTRIAAGASFDTNAAIVILDMHGGQAPARFWRQRPAVTGK